MKLSILKALLGVKKEEKIQVEKIGMADETSTIVPSTPTTSSDYKKALIRFKEEFDQKFSEQKVSESSEKLKEYKFLAILGQGAFGLVVIYHSSFSLSHGLERLHLFFFFLDLETCET